jgi:L-fuculose-phosphate aldolase
VTARASSLPAEREAVAAACRRLAAAGLVHETSGNVSVRADGRVAITPTGGRLAELEAKDISVVDLTGVHYEMLALGGPVPVAPYRTFGTPELAAAVLDALEGHAAALMANHGAIAHGGDLGEAVRRAELLERMCELYWRAAAIGAPRALDADARQAVVEAVLARGYGETRPA